MVQKLDREENLRQAYQASEQKSAVYEWMKQRSAAVREAVSAHDILRYHNISLKSSLDTEEQLSCPFHGKDNKPSARIYPSSGRSHSHLWCFTCQKTWDVFKLWRDFMGYGEEIRFSTILFEIERTFGLVAPDAPESVVPIDTGPTEADLEVDALFDVCEKRLREARYKYEPEKFLLTGQLLDQIHHRWDKRTIKASDAHGVLRQILDKIGTRIRAA